MLISRVLPDVVTETPLASVIVLEVHFVMGEPCRYLVGRSVLNVVFRNAL